MAKTAAVTTNLSSLQPGQGCVATLTITNADTNPVTVNYVQPYLTDAGGNTASSAFSFGQVQFGPNTNNQVFGSSGTNSQTFGISFFGPQGKGSNGLTASQTYTLGCLVGVVDNVTGTVTNISSSTASITVNSLF